jgi:hypothetical protein
VPAFASASELAPGTLAPDGEHEPSVARADHRRRRECAASHEALPAMRATTHVEGKAIRSSRRARRGAGCWLRTTRGASGRTAMSSSRIAWWRPWAARRPLTGRACPDGRPGGGAVRSATLRTIKRRSTAAAVCARFRPAVAVVGTRPDGALACRPQRERPASGWRCSLVAQRSSSERPRPARRGSTSVETYGLAGRWRASSPAVGDAGAASGLDDRITDAIITASTGVIGDGGVRSSRPSSAPPRRICNGRSIPPTTLTWGTRLGLGSG